jgi:hypothetical protein
MPTVPPLTPGSPPPPSSTPGREERRAGHPPPGAGPLSVCPDCLAARQATFPDGALRGTDMLHAGTDDAGFDTFRRERTVLVAVHTLTSFASLEVGLSVLAGDPRVALVHTKVPDQLGAGVGAALERAGVRVVPWAQAKRMRADLVIGASPHQLDHVIARKRMVLPHGGGYNKRWQRWNWIGPTATTPTFGLDRESLLYWDGAPVFDAVLLTHADQLAVLRDQCPEAESRAFVGGDIVYDSLVAAEEAHSRWRFRHTLGVGPGQKLVVLASTFGPDSLVATCFDELRDLVAGLPGDHRAVLVLHSGVWCHHGHRHVLDNLRAARAAGLDVVEVGRDWRGLVLSADYVVNDASSIGLYAAALGIPVLTTDLPSHVLDERSALAKLVAAGPTLDPRAPLLGQLHAAREAGAELSAIARRRISSEPARAARLLRAKLYELLDLTEPDWEPVAPEVRAPVLIRGTHERRFSPPPRSVRRAGAGSRPRRGCRVR